MVYPHHLMNNSYIQLNPNPQHWNQSTKHYHHSQIQLDTLVLIVAIIIKTIDLILPSLPQFIQAY
jgi:hypothetical protein